MKIPLTDALGIATRIASWAARRKRMHRPDRDKPPPQWRWLADRIDRFLDLIERDAGLSAQEEADLAGHLKRSTDELEHATETAQQGKGD